MGFDLIGLDRNKLYTDLFGADQHQSHFDDHADHADHHSSHHSSSESDHFHHHTSSSSDSDHYHHVSHYSHESHDENHHAKSNFELSTYVPKGLRSIYEPGEYKKADPFYLHHVQTLYDDAHVETDPYAFTKTIKCDDGRTIKCHEHKCDNWYNNSPYWCA